MKRLVLPNESPLQLIERPSGCRLLDKLAVDLVLVKLVQVERVRPGEIAIGHLLIGELILVDFLVRVRISQTAIADWLTNSCRCVELSLYILCLVELACY